MSKHTKSKHTIYKYRPDEMTDSDYENFLAELHQIYPEIRGTSRKLCQLVLDEFIYASDLGNVLEFFNSKFRYPYCILEMFTKYYHNSLLFRLHVVVYEIIGL